MAYLLLRWGVGSAAKAIPKHGAFPLPLRGPQRAAVSLLFTGSRTVLQRDTTTRTLSPRPHIFTKSFHASTSDGSACLSVTSCQCSECMKATRKPVCEICKVEPTAHQSAQSSSDQNGGLEYSFTSFCEDCWQGCREKYKSETLANRRAKRKRKTEAKQAILAAREEEARKLMVRINSILPGEQIPLQYAIHKFRTQIARKGQRQNSFKWNRRTLCKDLSEALLIVKVKGKGIHLCDKGRVDAFDFKLWFGKGI